MAALTTERLGDTVGAAVVGVDGDRLLGDEDLPGSCLDALDANGVLVFKDLHVDDATQVAFSRKLGAVELFPHNDPPEIFRVTLDPSKNPAAAYLRGTFDWHIDGCTDDVPIMATVLSAHAVAETGGETEFASSYQAYESLTPEAQARAEGTRVVHTIEASQRLVNDDPSPQELAIWRSRPSKEHPLVWKHRSGRRSLVLGATASHVVDMDLDEGRALLADLLEKSTAPERVYRHEWQVGDMVIWDNRGVLHRALPYDPASPRDMHRCTLAGDEVIG
ncbi:MAG TPA: TauD/TfdA family dioxygenase [Acidimicrobiales bacterium]|jgi:alpha-ketoglutarate-dependent taurine dioxygenase|nr:TauD/TfdA family dioxygenase [Acidimicrobiales bacterium]